MRTHQIMTRNVITVGAATPIVDAANIMLEKHISGLPVVDETGKLVGIVSQGDFIRRAEIGTQRKRGRWLKFLLGPGKGASDFVHERGRKVGEIMSLDPCTVTEDATLEDDRATYGAQHYQAAAGHARRSACWNRNSFQSASGRCRTRARYPRSDRRRRPHSQSGHHFYRESRLDPVWA